MAVQIAVPYWFVGWKKGITDRRRKYVYHTPRQKRPKKRVGKHA